MINSFKLESNLTKLADELLSKFPALSEQRKELEQLIVKNKLEGDFRFVNFEEIPGLNEEYFQIRELAKRYRKAFDNYCTGWWSQNIYHVFGEEQIPHLIQGYTHYLTGSVEKLYREKFLDNLGEEFDKEEQLEVSAAAKFLGISKRRMNWLRTENLVHCTKKQVLEGFMYVYSTKELNERRKEIHDALFERFSE